jgi:hypothetical protein
MADEIEGTFDKLKAGAKAVAKKVTDPSKDLGDEYDKERGKENSTGYEQRTGSGTSDPVSPEKIASHEPTAVKRDPSQGTSGEPVSSPSTNDTDVQGNQYTTPGVSATFSCQECGKTFSSRQELKDHTQQQH